MVFPEASEQKAAELGTSFEAWLLAQTDLNAEQERWLRMLGSQIARQRRQPGTKFMPEHFASSTPFSQMGGLHEAQRVFGGDDAPASADSTA